MRALFTLALLSLTFATQAATNETFLKRLVTPSDPAAIFPDKEFSLTLGGVYTAAEPRGLGELFDTDARGGDFGFVLGGTLWVNTYLGFGAEALIADISDVSSHVFDTSGLLLSGRYPIYVNFAPYALAGVGKDFRDGSFYATGGVGLEYRFTQSIGLFGEVRYVWAEEIEKDNFQARFGLRLNL